VPDERIDTFFNGAIRQKVVAAFKQLGYTYVAVDLEGYRTGSLNEELDLEKS